MPSYSEWLDRIRQEYCRAMQEAADTCYICHRSSDEVYEHVKRRTKQIYDGNDRQVMMRDLDQTVTFSWLSYRAVRPVCLLCAWSYSE